MSKAQEFLDWLYGPHGGSSVARAQNVVAWAKQLGDDEGAVFWQVVQAAWSMFDLIPHDDFAKLFARFASTAPVVDLPETLTIYRGQAGYSNGLSWTTDEKVAEGFAIGHRGMFNTHPIVLTATVRRDQVAFLCNDRDEREVVLKKKKRTKNMRSLEPRSSASAKAVPPFAPR